jgi:hypothetical protein
MVPAGKTPDVALWQTTQTSTTAPQKRALPREGPQTAARRPMTVVMSDYVCVTAFDHGKERDKEHGPDMRSVPRRLEFG